MDDKVIQFRPLQTPSSASSKAEHRADVAKRVKLMCGCFRRDDAADPAIYAGALVAVMEEYPIEVVDYVTSPRTGIPRNLKWLPSVAEVVEACNAVHVAQKQPMDARQPLGKPTPPSKVNPRMWDSPEAKARHERDYTKAGAGSPRTRAEQQSLGGAASEISSSLSPAGDGSA